MAADFQLLNSLRTTLAQTPELEKRDPALLYEPHPFCKGTSYSLSAMCEGTSEISRVLKIVFPTIG